MYSNCIMRRVYGYQCMVFNTSKASTLSSKSLANSPTLRPRITVFFTGLVEGAGSGEVAERSTEDVVGRANLYFCGGNCGTTLDTSFRLVSGLRGAGSADGGSETSLLAAWRGALAIGASITELLGAWDLGVDGRIGVGGGVSS